MTDDPVTIDALRHLASEPDEPFDEAVIGRAAAAGEQRIRRARRIRISLAAGAVGVVALAAAWQGLPRSVYPAVPATTPSASDVVRTPTPTGDEAPQAELPTYPAVCLQGSDKCSVEARGVVLRRFTTAPVPIGATPITREHDVVLPLADGIAPGDVVAVNKGGPSGQLWMLAQTAAGRLTAYTWTMVDWPPTAVILDAGMPATAQLERATVASDATGRVFVEALYSGPGAGRVFFASKDAGASFSRVKVSAEVVPSSADWSIASDGRTVIATGTAGTQDIVTSADQGRTWRQPVLPSLPVGTVLGTPIVEGSRIWVPAVVPDDTSATLVVLISSDAGATFVRKPIGPATVSAANPVAGHSGDTWWITDGDTVYRSADGLATTLSTTAKVPPATAALIVTSLDRATAVLRQDRRCPASTPAWQCTDYSFLETHDAGLHWTIY